MRTATMPALQKAQNPRCGFREGAGSHFSGQEWQIVVDESVVPRGRGKTSYAVRVATLPDLTLTLTEISNATVATTVLNRDYIGVLLPVSATSEFRINGESADDRDLVWTDSSGMFHLQGANRISIAGAVRKSRLIDTLAALRGFDPEDVRLELRTVRQSRREAAAIRRRLKTISDSVQSNPLRAQDPAVEYATITALIDIILKADLTDRRRERSHRAWSKIVEAAEERFCRAGAERVSLADLCQAAGVSKRCLNTAFMNVCGMPPMDYFLKRRLCRAHRLLLRLPPERGAVTRAALESGLPELGRFAVRYRELFGESPRETLRRSA